MPPYAITLSDATIASDRPTFVDGEGAELQFLGTVRGLEEGRQISGIDYSAYPPMVEQMFAKLITAGQQLGAHEVFIQHRIGFVEASEPSILIWVRTKHSALAFDLCRWYLKEVKATVPIWKKPIPLVS